VAWKEDIKRLVKLTGVECKPTVFLFSDSQMKEESFLEDVNGLLNSGEVSDLWTAEEYNDLLEALRPLAKRMKRAPEGTPAQLYNLFLDMVRSNLHIVLCMSPIGDAFRTRLRMYPSLINCCTIDWFDAWPADALASVAADFLSALDMPDATRSICVDICQTFHRSVEDSSVEFLNELGRYYYVTPTSYLELIGTFITLLNERRGEVSAARNRYLVGLEKVYATEESVKHMQVELEEMQPVLIKTAEETEAMIVVVNKENEDAQVIKDGVAKEEAVASKAAQASQAMADECTADLAEAMPILAAAMSALDTLTPGDITEVKGMKSPPPGVRLVCECLCIMKGVKPTRAPDPAGNGKFIMDYWPSAKKSVLSDPKLLKSLKEYDKDNIPPAIIKQVHVFFKLVHNSS
jgi:dynein heavy chain